MTLAIAPETGGLLAERARIILRAGGRSLGSLRALIGPGPVHTRTTVTISAPAASLARFAIWRPR